MIYYKSVAPERESCRNNTLISGYISDVHCIVNRINRWSDLLHRLFLIDDFGIHLGHLYRCMTEQFRYSVQIGPQCQHHCGERVAGGMKGESLGNSGGFGPWFDKLVDTRRQIEHMVVCCLVPTFRHPLQRFIGERKVNRFFRLLHGYCQAVLAVVNKHIFPLQSDNVTDT